MPALSAAGSIAAARTPHALSSAAIVTKAIPGRVCLGARISQIINPTTEVRNDRPASHGRGPIPGRDEPYHCAG